MKYLVVIILLLSLFACTNDNDKMEIADENWSKDKSIAMNSEFAGEEEVEIEMFLASHHDWKMTKTGTGLRYMIYQKGDGKDSAKVGDIVTVNFEISLLDGEICYSSSEKGAESFMVEKSDVESGLHEGIQYLCEGDRAKLIIPSRAAHGLIGDTEKIPPLSPLIFDIELLKISKQ